MVQSRQKSVPGNSSAIEMGSNEALRVLLVSALPPPVGGLATWTQLLKERGLPKPFELEIVDTKVARQHSSEPSRLNWGEVRRTIRILNGIHRLLRSGKFSVMHLSCSLYYTGAPRNLVSALIARRAGTPYVAHLHGLFKVPLGNDLAQMFFRWAYRTIFDGAASILALGQPSYRSVVEFGDFEHKTQIIPNFVDTPTAPKKSTRSERERGLRVVYVGTLVESKGAYTVVEVAQRFPDARFRLIGTAHDNARMKLSQLIRERRLEDRVQMVGPFPQKEVLAMLEEYDVFILPSKREGFPISVAEAMSVGLPVVASPVGAIPEMIDAPAGGYLVAPDDVTGYVEALACLRDDPSLRMQMGHYNRQKAIQQYDYDVVVRELCNIYRRIV